MQSDIKPKERLILLNAEMVRAVLDVRTQRGLHVQADEHVLQQSHRQHHLSAHLPIAVKFLMD